MALTEKQYQRITFDTKSFFRKKPNKYLNKKSVNNGITFDSKKELERWKTLQILVSKNLIHSLQRQVTFFLLPKNDKFNSVRYIADFVYYKNGQKIIEDVKGYKTKEYILKKKMMYHFHKILIQEI